MIHTIRRKTERIAMVYNKCSLNVKTVSKDVYAGHGKTHMAVRK